MAEHEHHQISTREAISLLAFELHALAEKPHNQTILHRLDQIEKNIMSKVDDLIAAATALSTASDGVSLRVDSLVEKVDALVVKIDAAVAVLQNQDLSPEGETALASLKSARDTAAAESTKAAAAGDRVDAEVTKLDTILPQPAPAAPPVA